jgi:hypothetical protein
MVKRNVVRLLHRHGGHSRGSLHESSHGVRHGDRGVIRLGFGVKPG